MEDNDNLAAFAFCVTVDAIRKAQGKMMPEDLPDGSIERMLAEVDVIHVSADVKMTLAPK